MEAERTPARSDRSLAHIWPSDRKWQRERESMETEREPWSDPVASLGQIWSSDRISPKERSDRRERDREMTETKDGGESGSSARVCAVRRGVGAAELTSGELAEGGRTNRGVRTTRLVGGKRRGSSMGDDAGCADDATRRDAVEAWTAGSGGGGLDTAE
ncbi:hypothetical protein Scep_023625 [Stephania cephalantha]|uniref:Uncharacterized protein n=1 Tax=Stephania cephalantha TaxID=152367 RepID=A0AAP0EV13_9MAGN